MQLALHADIEITQKSRFNKLDNRTQWKQTSRVFEVGFMLTRLKTYENTLEKNPNGNIIFLDMLMS